MSIRTELKPRGGVSRDTPYKEVSIFSCLIMSYPVFPIKKIKLDCCLKQVVNSPNRRMAATISQMIAKNIRRVITKSVKYYKKIWNLP